MIDQSRACRVFLVLVLTSVMTAFCSAEALAAPPAKNVILMIADGAGFNAFEAASYYQYGALDKQAYERFPVHFGCTTYMLNYVDAEGNTLVAGGAATPKGAVGTKLQGYDPQAMWKSFNYCKGKNNYTIFTDSAAAATALYTGAKTTRGRIATGWQGKVNLTTIAEVADAAGRATGTISSVEASHATPGCVWAHNESREHYVAIFKDMVVDSQLDVIMGAGHPFYNNNGDATTGDLPASAYSFVGGKSTWDKLTQGDGYGFRFIQSKEDFEKLARGEEPTARRVVGITQVRKTLQYSRSGRDMAPKNSLNDNVPTLETMTRGAINVLSKDPDGFFLMIEGGAVDWGNHDRNGARMIEEMVDFNDSVQAVVDWVEANSSWEETLLVITADHECGMLWGKATYADRNGNGQFEAKTDKFNSWKTVTNRGKGNLPEYQYGSGGHTNALVPLWAIGPGSERFAELVDGQDTKAGQLWGFSGKFVDNTDVFDVMSKALAPPEKAR